MMQTTRILRGVKFRVRSPLHHTAQHDTLLVSPYGTELHGFGRGPQSTIPPSPEVALALLTEAVPFHQDALIIFPESRQNAESESAMLKQMREHFLRVHHGNMTLSQHVAGKKCFSTPLEKFDEHSLDIVCFAGNCFSSVLEQRSILISEAHRALRRHGVVAIHGARKLRVVAPERAVVDYNDFSTFIDDEYSKLSIASDALRRHTNRNESVDCGHSDIYLPFPHVKRRWFTSGYEVPVSHLTGYIRSWESYQSVVKPARCEGDPPGVCRHRVGRIDPLQALEGLLLESTEKVTIEIDTFVVTCDSRPHNTQGEIGDGGGHRNAVLT